MADLDEQLSAALGAAYRIERELGGGGMSRVFLAEETGLGRKVVVKVLPPEMAAGVNQDRFRREIQLAARLQHPHIVPLLSAGSSGDLLYYIMPFIKGESLRAKLARESELPVAEAVRILREVTDALAYAHEEGVVHRDIKPDNVMISGGHALVTDFGVAKAVSEATGGHSLTSMGLAIGTPAYMAPEQASGDPHVDHRADLYALGAMGFEMLAGRPPFTGPNPQSLLAAHVSQVPENVSQLRAAVPVGLNTVVMRCLEKRAADRWQHAKELLPHLDLLLTPSTGGTAPTLAAYPVSTGTEAALRRSHPVRVFGTFALASIGVLGVVWLLVQQLGLPNWVFYGAAGLLVIGLPIILITARHERQRAIARTTNTYLAAPAGVQRLFTWQKALTGGAFAFAGLGVLTIGYTAMRLLGIGSVGTLMARGELGERDRIVLAEFENRTPDSTLGATVTELFRTDLAQSRSVSVYDVAQLGEVISRMQLPRGTRITADIAKDAATREGVKAVLAGDITPLGGGYILSARLIGTKTGDVLWAGRENAGAEGLPEAIDKLSATLRERVGESLRSIRADPPLAQMTTNSTEALRLYVQGERAADAGDRESAISLTERAIAQDSNFAMAYRKLGIHLRNQSSRDSARYKPLFEKAYAMRERLSIYERYLAEAAYHTVITRDSAKAIAAYRAVLDVYPDDRVSGNNLGLLLSAQGKRSEALQAYRGSIRSGTAGVLTYQNALNIVTAIEGVDSAGAMIEAFNAAFPENPDAQRRRVQYLLATERYDSAQKLLQQRREVTRGNPRFQSGVLYDLVNIAFERGRLDEGISLFREATRLEEQASPPQRSSAAENAKDAEIDVLRFRRDFACDIVRDAAAAAAFLDQEYRIRPIEERTRANPGAYLSAARDYARVNRADLAKAYWTRWESAQPDSVRANLPTNALRTRAELARAERRFDDAIRDLHLAREKSRNCVECESEALFMVFYQAGRADSALAYFERLRTMPRLGVRAPADIYERAAQLSEQLGDKAKAITYYQKVVEVWKDADAVLQPRVKAAREKVAVLGGR